MRILLIEDHSELRRLVAEHLSRGGYAVDAFSSFSEGLTALKHRAAYQAVVLDLGLPDGDGLTLLAALRQSPDTAPPVLIVTARDALDSRVAGLDAGADDYLVKPFEFAELDARLRAILRRPGARSAILLVLGDLEFEPATRRVSVAGIPLDLARREAALLEALLRAHQRVVVKEMLEEMLYSADEMVTVNAVEACVSRLRKRLLAAASACRLETHRGIGYSLICDEAP